jgi:hypothetical protein
MSNSPIRKTIAPNMVLSQNQQHVAPEYPLQVVRGEAPSRIVRAEAPLRIIPESHNMPEVRNMQDPRPQHIMYDVSAYEYESPSEPEPITLFIIALVAFLFIGWIFQICWNYTVPDLFNIRQINYYQSLIILIMANIIFGSGAQCVSYARHI